MFSNLIINFNTYNIVIISTRSFNNHFEITSYFCTI